MTFHNQVSVKLHDMCSQNAILHVIDSNEPLSIANTTVQRFCVFSKLPSRTFLEGIVMIVCRLEKSKYSTHVIKVVYGYCNMLPAKIPTFRFGNVFVPPVYNC